VSKFLPLKRRSLECWFWWPFERPMVGSLTFWGHIDVYKKNLAKTTLFGGFCLCAPMSSISGFLAVRQCPKNAGLLSCGDNLKMAKNGQKCKFANSRMLTSCYKIFKFAILADPPPPIFRKSALPLLSVDLLESPISTLALIKDPQNPLSRPSNRRAIVKIVTFGGRCPSLKQSLVFSLVAL
jgi:hypothetical protein